MADLLDKHCRLCGHFRAGKGKAFKQRHRNFLSWRFPIRKFDSPTLFMCSSCDFSLKKRKDEYFNGIRFGYKPTKKLRLAFWDNNASQPYFDSDGNPLPDLFRGEVDPIDSNDQEIELQMQGLTNETPLHTESNNLSITQQKTAKKRKGAISTMKIRKNPPRMTTQEKTAITHSKVLQINHEGIKEIHTSDKGRGVATTRQFKRNEFITTYHGKLVSKKEADRLEKKYALEKKGCYMYYGRYNQETFCIDSTDENENFGLGRLINHETTTPNIKSQKIIIDNRPYIYFSALEDIEAGIELLYNYNDPKSEADFM